MILLNDPKIQAIPVRENGNPLIDLQVRFPELQFDESRKFVQKTARSISWGREQIGMALVRAQKKLPSGIRFLMKECYRPLSVQIRFWNQYQEVLRKKFPDLNADDIDRECSKYIAPPSVAPHSTGGAVDLLLIDDHDQWLEMGSQFNADPSECDGATFTDAKNISQTAMKHRRILQEALESEGFVNYPTEWWHWSFGDQYWAFVRKEPAALFSSVQDFPESQL